MTPLIHPEALFESLSANATTRTRRSLEAIHRVCQEQHDRGSPDFSIPTVARLSEAIGGPSEQTIRNRTGAHYRALLGAWAAFSEGSTKKPQQKPAPLTEETVLPRIEDPATRAVVGMILSKNKKLLAEIHLLKHNANIVIDRRQREWAPEPTGKPPDRESSAVVEVPPANLGLSKIQIEALVDATSPEMLERMGWTVQDNGRVMKGARPIYKPGYVDAIRAILDAVEKNGQP